ncbi:MAG: PorP/SprF family type IX secretion system membrane protein [Spirosomataceae bacterium]
MKKRLIPVLIAVGFGFEATAQAPQFSQFYTNPIFQNPALAGDAGAGRFIVNYRNQWQSVGIPYQTMAASFDTYAEDAQVGLGIQLMHDRRGAFMKSNSVAGQVSRQFVLDANSYYRLTPGLQAAWVSNQWNGSDLTFVAQYATGMPDPLAQPDWTDNRLAVSSGLRFDYDPQTDHEASYWAGISYHNMGYRNDDWLRERWGLQMGAQFPLGASPFSHGYGRDLDRESALSLALQLRRQGVNKQLDVGANLIFSPLLFGLWYRGLLVDPKRRDALIGTIGWARDKLLFQASYDLTISSLGTDTGTFELAVWYGLDALFSFSGKNRNARRKTRCLKY